MNDLQTRMMENEKLLTAAEAAELLGLQVSTVRRLTYERRLPVVRPTGKRCVRYKRSDLMNLINMRHQPMRETVR